MREDRFTNTEHDAALYEERRGFAEYDDGRPSRLEAMRDELGEEVNDMVAVKLQTSGAHVEIGVDADTNAVTIRSEALDEEISAGEAREIAAGLIAAADEADKA